MEVCVLGGGLAGLTAIWTLSKLSSDNIDKIYLVEKNNYLGGLVYTKKIGDKFYDFGPHIFHSKDELILKEFKPKLETAGFYPVKTFAKSFWRGKFYDYPMSVDNIFELPRELGRKAVSELYKVCPDDVKNASSFEEYVKNLVGETLFNIFFKGYTEKLWGVNTSEIPSDWAPQRISFRMEDKTFFGKNEWETYHNEGIGKLSETLMHELSKNFMNKVDILLNSKAREIKYDGKKYMLALDSGVELSCDLLISSIPLDELLKLLGETPKPLEYRSSIVVFLELRREYPILPSNWIYINEKEYPFTRIFEPPSLLPNYSGNTWITVEYHVNKNDELWRLRKEDLVQYTVDYLVRLGLTKTNDILKWDVWKAEYTYPILTFETKVNLQYNLNLVRKFKNLIIIGRLGKFKYMNMDTTIVDTIKTIKNKLKLGV